MALIHNVSFNQETRVLSLSDRAGNVISSCEVPARVVVKPLTFTSRGDGSVIRLAKRGTLSNEFEVDVGNGWTPYNLGTSITRNSGETVKFRCVNHPTTQSASKYIHFEMSGVFEASGDCNSLLSPNYASLLSLDGYGYAFYKLFYGCGSLTTAPELPATTLSVSCYDSMFYGCTSLIQAPELPATTLATQCYSSMFRGCTSLEQAPDLPAMTLTDSCYSYMFVQCSSLTQVLTLSATTLAKSCYSYMFYGCTALTQVPSLPVMELEEGCYEYMFNGCVSMTQAPALPATTLAKKCYNGMFRGCSSLIYAPTLPGTELEESCYESMFRDCVSLTQAPSALPAIEAVPRCYFSMFEGCTSLINAPTIAATTCRISADKYNNAHLSYMFRNCTALANPPEIHLTTLAYNALYFMFAGCTSLIRAPHLPAMTLAEGCYYGIFNGCSSLTEASIAATTTATNALTNWLNSVAASGTVYADPSLTLPTDSASGVPTGWVRAQLPGTRSIEPEPEPVLRSAKKTKPRFDPYLIP